MDAIISENDGVANIWGDSYFNRRPPRHNFLLAPSSSVAAAVQAIRDATAAAGTNGTLIFNVGHGASNANPYDGVVDLAPGRKLRLGGANTANTFVNVFYDVNLSGPEGFSGMDNDLKFNAGLATASERQRHWQTYKQICQLFRQARLYKVVFITCRVGNSTEFLRKIANDWGTIIEAYKRRMVVAPQPNGRTRMYLEGDAPGSGTNVPAAEENLPLATESNSLRVGPP